jgi:hypothetical protein
MFVLPEQGTPVPQNGPVPKTILFSGAKGWVPAGTSSHMIFIAMPSPPMKSLYLSVSSVEILPVVRFTRSILPVYP